MKVMVNGLPGNMSTALVNRLIAGGFPDLTLIPYSLASARAPPFFTVLDEPRIRLVRPEDRDREIERIRHQEGPFISVDYTRDSIVAEQVEFYCQSDLPFVMGTTGGDRAALEERVRSSNTVAVIAPNMALPIVALQEVIEKYAAGHPGELAGCTLDITESHRKDKEGASGTARAMVPYFNMLGVLFEEKEITKIRKPDLQRVMGVPEWALDSHAWHTYTIDGKVPQSFVQELLGFIKNPLFQSYSHSVGGGAMTVQQVVSPDRTVTLTLEIGRDSLAITHNLNGRDAYVDGTLHAFPFLQQRVEMGDKGRAYNMTPVLDALRRK